MQVVTSEARAMTGQSREFERNTGFEPTTFALARRHSTGNFADNTPDYLLN